MAGLRLGSQFSGSKPKLLITHYNASLGETGRQAIYSPPENVILFHYRLSLSPHPSHMPPCTALSLSTTVLATLTYILKGCTVQLHTYEHMSFLVQAFPFSVSIQPYPSLVIQLRNKRIHIPTPTPTSEFTVFLQM